MASIDFIVVRSIRFWQLQCIYLSSRTFKFYFNFMFYFSYLLIDFLPLTPRGCATALADEYVPNFSHWVLGFKYQAAQVSNFA